MISRQPRVPSSQVRIVPQVWTRISEGRRGTAHVGAHVVVGLLRLEARRIPTGTRGKQTVASKPHVRAASGVGSPCEVARPRATGTLPGRATGDGITGAERSVGPTCAGVRPSKGDAAFLPLHHLRSISRARVRGRPATGPDAELVAVSRPIGARRTTVLQRPTRVANVAGASTSAVLPSPRPTARLRARTVVGRQGASSKSGAATAVDGPRTAPFRLGTLMRSQRNQPSEKSVRGTSVVLTSRLLALGPTQITGTPKTLLRAPVRVLPA